MNRTSIQRLFFILFSLVVFCDSGMYANGLIRIQGIVKELSTQRVLKHVNIAGNGMLLGITNQDGFFELKVNPEDELIFNLPGYNDLKIKVDNRQVIDVYMTEREIEIAEVLVFGKTKNKKILVEPTDLEVTGNYFHIRTKFKVSERIFKSHKRFLVQPVLHNNTTKITQYFHPVVIDGNLFRINNYRFNEFDISRDSLQLYIEENKLKETNHIYAYKDSLYVESGTIDHDFSVKCYLAVNAHLPDKEDYLDTLTIARGTKRPLRFMECRFDPVEITDSALVPKPEMTLHSEKGVSRISFRMNQASINMDDLQNIAELNVIYEKLQQILSDEFATLQAISVTGYTSPDGPYDKNLLLAQKRTQVILKEIKGSLTKNKLQFIKLQTDAKVESWRNVAQMMHADSLSFAYKADSILLLHKEVPGPTHWAFKKLEQYKDVIAPIYLTRLRRTEYTLDYSIFRKLKDTEIQEKYRQGNTDLSRFEYWRLTELAETPEACLKQCAEALKRFPDFLFLANQMAVHSIRNNQYDTTILEASLQNSTLWEVRYNQAIMALGLKEYALADSLSMQLPDNEECSFMKAVIAAFNGRYAEAYPVIASKGGLNEVLILLCLNRNRDAEQKISQLLELPENTNNSQMWYVRAVCANRNDNLTVAIEALRRALSLNPSLKEIAVIDSDILDIVELIESQISLNW